MHCPMCATPRQGQEVLCRSCGYRFEHVHGFLPAGTLLQNKYRIDEVLGQGGFGITYAATQLHLDLKVAIKELFLAGSFRQSGALHPPATMNAGGWQQAVEDFTAEARILARFQHPDIVRVLDIFNEQGTAYLVMEHLQGETLQNRIQREGRLPAAQVLELATRTLQALAVVHGAGMLHRDLKPENIFLEHSGRTVLIDFGSARDFVGGQTVAHTRLVTPGYAPLEQYGNAARFGPYTDLYALGATLYHALTGESPPAATDRTLGASLSPLPSDAPVVLQKMVHKCLEVRVQDRPQTVQDVLSQLQPPQVPAPAPAPKPLPNPQPTKSAGPPASLFWAVGMVLLLGGAYLGFSRTSTAETPPSQGMSPPEEQPEAQPNLQQVFTIQQASLYAEANANQTAVASVPTGQRLEYTRTTEGWYQVQHQGSLYWISAAAVLPLMDFETVQQLQASLSAGGEVTLQRGVYVLDQTLMLNQPVSLTGQGEDQTLLLSSAPEDVLVAQGVDVQLSGFGVLHTGNPYARILTVDGGQADLQHVTFSGATRNETTQEFGSAVWLKNHATVNLTDSELSGNAYGVYVSDSSVLNVTSSLLSHNSLGGVTFREQSSGHLEQNTISANGVHGVHVMGDATPELVDNTIENNAQRGISVYDRAKPSISANRILRNGYQGVGIQDQASPFLERNTIAENQQSGLTYFDAATGEAHSNIIQSNQKSGVAVTQKAHPLLTLNTIQNNKEAGIAFSESASGQAEQNTIVGNGNPGVSAWGKARPQVLRNTIQNNQQSGVVFAEEAAGTISGNTIENNALYGMVITDAARPNVESNDLLGNQRAALFYKRKASGQARNNYCEDNLQGDIRLDLLPGQPGPTLDNPGCLLE